MSLTLRVREAEGHTTKPAPDIDENRLTAEEIDDNFLSLEALAPPAGGTTGQVLAKASNADHATEWVDQSGGSGITAAEAKKIAIIFG